MKRQINKIRIVGIICIGMIFLLTWRFCSIYRNQEKNLLSESFILFEEAIQKEKEQQIKIYKGYYDPQKSPNDIPGEEKHAWCSQDYLTKRDPNRHLLDSIFQDILQKQNIDVKAAIRCIRKGAVINSLNDSLFYKEATPLKPIIYRIDENKKKNIMLQAYVNIPIRTVLGQIGWLWIISFSFFIVLAGGCGFYFEKVKDKIERIIRLLRISRRSNNELIRQQKVKLAELQAQKQEVEHISKQQAELIEQKQAELSALQNKIVPLDTKQKITWVALPCDLFFAERHGVLRDKDGQTVCLKNNPLRLFRHFLQAEDHKLTYEDICINVLERPIKDGINQSARENVSTTVHRLKEYLTPFPCIKIDPLRGTGYQMRFFNNQTDSTLPDKAD